MAGHSYLEFIIQITLYQNHIELKARIHYILFTD